MKHHKKCKKKALQIFNHNGKINAIISACRIISISGFDVVKSNILSKGIKYLEGFDFIGPTTCYHLAKNIGLDVVKPDRHLVRIAKASNFHSPNSLCEAISNVTGDKVSVIDIILWRFATIEPAYVNYFK